MTGDTPHKRKPSPVGILALIGGLIGLAQWVNGPADAYTGGVPFELIGAIGGGAILGALAGWIWLRLTGKSQTPRSR